MIIDDDPDDTEMFCQAVDSLALDCLCIMKSSCEETFKHLEDNILPDFIFLDLNMPRLGGKECLEMLKANPNYANIPVVIYSTSNRKEEMTAMLKAGATAYIVKPNSYRELANTLSKFFGQ